MATLAKLPSEAIIAGFKGTIDFYLWKGIRCARRWPRSPGPRRAATVEAQWPAFGYAASLWTSLSAEVQRAYVQSATGSTLTGRDLFVKSFISDYFREGQWT